MDLLNLKVLILNAIMGGYCNCVENTRKKRYDCLGESCIDYAFDSLVIIFFTLFIFLIISISFFIVYRQNLSSQCNQLNANNSRSDHLYYRNGNFVQIV